MTLGKLKFVHLSLRPFPELELSAVLDALSDPTRRQIVLRLAAADFCCSSFNDLGPKTRLTYHFARLERAGLVYVTPNGRRRVLTLNFQGLEQAFPGLLPAVLQAVSCETACNWSPQKEEPKKRLAGSRK